MTKSPGGKHSGTNGSDPRSGYYNLDMMNPRKVNQSPANQSEMDSFCQGPTIEHFKNNSNINEGNQIRRTDYFSVEYSSH